MKKRLSTLCFALAICLSLAGSLFLGFEKVACDAGQYTALQDRFGLYGEIGVSREEMAPAMEALAAYIRGEAETYNRNVVMFGENRPLFNEKELTHMVDVLGLFRLERAVRTACLAAAARLCRFVLVLLGLGFGIFGLVFGLILLTYYLCTLESFGTPYLAPFCGGSPGELLRALLRLPLKKVRERPAALHPEDVRNQK